MSRNQRRKQQSGRPAAGAQEETFTIDQMFSQAVKSHVDGKLKDAELLYRAIIATPPLQSEASYNLGLLYQTEGRLIEAVPAYRNAVTLRPDHVDAYSNLGTALQALGLMDQALAVYRTAIAIKPEHDTTYCNIGVALKEHKQLEPAVVSYRRAITLRADYDWAYANLAAVLLDLDQLDESIDACRAALALNGRMTMALFNLGTALRARNDLAGAEAALREAIRVNPDFTEAHFTLGQTLLQQERYEEGWREYEWRWKLSQYSWLRSLHGDFAQPRWEGETIAGKTLLVYAEQGLGDAIQYVRYIPGLAAATGATIIFAVHHQLLRLFERQLPGVTLIRLDQQPLPAFDVHSPLLSLPRLLKTTAHNIPVAPSYLQADPVLVERWRGRIGDSGKKKVGIVWSGNPEQTGDRLRSPGLPAVMPLFETPGIQFVALQLGPGRAVLETTPLPDGVLDLGLEIADLSDTAAIMANLDLMISSCTAPLHLAAALGVRTWGMIPFAPHFLWQNERRDSPWYPSLTLYRQDRIGDWSDVMGAIRADLEAL